MEREFTYRLFQMPHRFSTYKPQPRRCELCGETRPGYDGPFYGVEDIDFVCEPCLHAGRLRDRNLFTQTGDVESLRYQLSVYHREMSETERESLITERNDELEHRTPHLVTWQDMEWPAHCGDY